MKLLILILMFIDVWPWLLSISIIVFLKIQLIELKYNFFNMSSNNLSGIKILSKLYNYKYICKRNYSTRIIYDKNSDFYNMYTNYWTEIHIYKDKYQGFFYVAGNFITNSFYSKLADVGILHKNKSVHFYDKYIIKKYSKRFRKFNYGWKSKI